MLTGPYSKCYARVYVFSPSCAPGVDPAWGARRKHAKTHMNVPDGEQTIWDTREPGVLEKLIERHKKVKQYLKAKKQKKGHAILRLVDDFADAGEKVTNSSTNI